jgi:hypothetical protein
MAEYRVYTVGLAGHFIRFEPLVCHDDGEAAAKAKRMVDGHDVEVLNRRSVGNTAGTYEKY